MTTSSEMLPLQLMSSGVKNSKDSETLGKKRSTALQR